MKIIPSKTALSPALLLGLKFGLIGALTGFVMHAAWGDLEEDQKAYYQKKYGLLPSFKAGLHMGEVTITEIGVSKKEIAYHGDTINTTSRICASAHRLGKRFLVSKPLFEKLNTDMEFEDLGEHSFKGKEESIHIFGY